MLDIRADEPAAREPERLVFGDGEGSPPSADGSRAVAIVGHESNVRRDQRQARTSGLAPPRADRAEGSQCRARPLGDVRDEVTA